MRRWGEMQKDTVTKCDKQRQKEVSLVAKMMQRLKGGRQDRSRKRFNARKDEK